MAAKASCNLPPVREVGQVIKCCSTSNNGLPQLGLSAAKRPSTRVPCIAILFNMQLRLDISAYDRMNGPDVELRWARRKLEMPEIKHE